jgi:hypothetical protein
VLKCDLGAIRAESDRLWAGINEAVDPLGEEGAEPDPTNHCCEDQKEWGSFWAEAEEVAMETPEGCQPPMGEVGAQDDVNPSQTQTSGKIDPTLEALHASAHLKTKEEAENALWLFHQ